jgi:hypothetical protein
MDMAVPSTGSVTVSALHLPLAFNAYAASNTLEVGISLWVVSSLVTLYGVCVITDIWVLLHKSLSTKSVDW